MTRYEIIREQLIDLRTKQLIAVMVPAGIVAALLITFVPSGALFIALVAFVISVIGFHWAWERLFVSYRDWAHRYSQIAAEIQSLERCIANIFNSYPQRRSGEQFKKAYDLNGRSVKDLEEALAVGMLRERREVFVTAFMRQGRAVRVTASMGSPFRCRASDDPMRWTIHVFRLKCDEIRQYHNHPVHNGVTGPSTTDIQTTERLRVFLGTHFSKLRSLIICWNRFGEWKVFEHDETGHCWLHSEFDASTELNAIQSHTNFVTPGLPTGGTGRVTSQS